MNEKTVTITEKDGAYRIQNDGLSEFALIGLLECVVFDLKTASRSGTRVERTDAAAAPTETSAPAPPPPPAAPEPKQSEPDAKSSPDAKKESAPPAAGNSEIRTRIANAVKAIRGLGGKIEDIDISRLTDEELQSELEELTEQYKRLKNSKAAK